MNIEYQQGIQPAVRELLELARNTNQRIRVWYGYQDGSSWEHEEGVIGYITPRGISGINHPYIFHNTTSKQGYYLAAANVVKLIISKVVVYEHETFSQPDYSLIHTPYDLDVPYWVTIGNKLVKRFKDSTDAERWIEFMQGKRMNISGRKL